MHGKNLLNDAPRKPRINESFVHSIFSQEYIRAQTELLKSSRSVWVNQDIRRRDECFHNIPSFRFFQVDSERPLSTT